MVARFRLEEDGQTVAPRRLNAGRAPIRRVS
jgi:hypothetical protein